MRLHHGWHGQGGSFLFDRQLRQPTILIGVTHRFQLDSGYPHHHGIHQAGDSKRAERVVRVIEMINAKPSGSQ